MSSKMVPIRVMKENPNDEFAILVEWLVKNGNAVSANDPVALLEFAKVAVEITAPEAGVLRYQLEAGDQIGIGSALAYICESADQIVHWGFVDGFPQEIPAVDQSSSKISGADPETIPVNSLGDLNSRFTAKALRLMKTHGLTAHDFSDLPIVKEQDVLAVAASFSRAAEKISVVHPSYSVEKPSTIKRFEIASLERTSLGAFTSLVVRSVDADKMLSQLRALGHEYVGISLGELLTFGMAQVLPNFPLINSFYQNSSTNIYHEINVGYAISISGRGLMVPVLHRASECSLLQMSARIKDYALRYLRNELTASDLSGATFTVTDLSSYEVEFFDPIIGLHQCAIAGICSLSLKSLQSNLVLKFDHRLTDGQEVAIFLKGVAEYLRNYLDNKSAGMRLNING